MVRVRAAEAAASAAARAGVEVGELVAVGELHAAADLFIDIWGPRPDGPPISRDLLRAFAHTGNYVAGASVGSRLVGASVGFLGKGGGITKLHSHVTGLAPDVQQRGIGFALKLHQRAWALAHDLPVITWTFDPLVRRNAFFNLTKLGAEATAFHANFYGEMPDRINGGDESDRCDVVWDAGGHRAALASTSSLPEPDVGNLLSGGAQAVLEDRGDGQPRTGALAGDVRLAWIPPDVVELRRRAPEVARAWRLALRETLGASVEEGFVAAAMSRAGWYVLERRR